MTTTDSPSDTNIKHRHWEAHLRSWEKSGLSQAEYCRQNNLKVNRLTYWKRKFERESATPIQLVPVPTDLTLSNLAEVKCSCQLRLAVAGNFHIEIGDGFSSDTLTRLIVVLEGM